MLAQVFSRSFPRLSFLFILAAFLLPLAVSAQVNINTADLETLDTLPGVGPVIAQRIIDYRDANGFFENIEELKNVTGIGDVVFSNLKDFVTVGTSGNQNEPPSTETATSTSSSSKSSSSSGSPSSSLSSPTTAAISGGDRVGAAGSPIEFRVEKGGGGGESVFKWNFGDGAQSGGSVVNHVYDYPGDYTVVLSLSTSQDKVADRVNVKVIEPEISVTLANADRVELFNPSSQEINLFGRAISVGGKVFMFPKDTIVRPSAKISFSSRITGLAPNHAGEVEWAVIGESRDVHRIGQIVEARREERIANIKTEIDQLEQRLVLARANTNNVSAQSLSSNVPSVAVEEVTEEVGGSSESNLAAAISSGVDLNSLEEAWFRVYFKKLTKFFLGPR